MSFWRTFMGDYGQDLNIADAQSEIADLQKAVLEKAVHDRRQDAAVEKLDQRVRELEQGLSALMKRLTDKEVLTTVDLHEFARFMTAAERKAAAERAAAAAEEARRAAADPAETRASEILREIDES
jgi:hypothetical protein